MVTNFRPNEHRVINIIPDVKLRMNRLASLHQHNSFIFGFQFRLHQVRCIYFGKTETLLISFADINVAWQIEISNQISELIPNEVYAVIKNLLKDDEKFSNRPFFLSLCSALERLEEVQAVSDEEIIEHLGRTRTNDRNYDGQGDRPFFDHWRRVAPSSDGLRKIERVFGKAIRQECYLNKVTGVWFPTPTGSSLDFRDPDLASKKIKRLRNDSAALSARKTSVV